MRAGHGVEEMVGGWCGIAKRGGGEEQLLICEGLMLRAAMQWLLGQS